MSPVQHFMSDPDSVAVDDRSPTPKPLKQTRDFPVVRTAPCKPLVLVLEDDEETSEAFKEVLEESGFDTVCLPNGELGLEHLAHYPAPAAIVLDLMMPVMDGWTFVTRLRELPPLKDIPIVVATAAGPHWGYPVVPVLRKPVGRFELVATLRTVIEATARRRAGS
jgi:CheY-like chemotaxis protein